ncbi:hypothetical protein NQ117_05395 [Paenibacillus sp. SC116]|uniref:hypothetical protein n=1 Tax=Paenibacillus sp. SC116 TaxID=2968986 RepID=UPI00215AE2E1|nr:hypothetical protein [Paenibacillus sp. SC116]MCR8843107.1 hypothetical protein [Paenibacillus sp. SC116]
MTKIDGRKAEVIYNGCRYPAYTTFAKQFGYPDAAEVIPTHDTRMPLRDGDFVTLLVSGEHLSYSQDGALWIVEAENGERHIINEKGLRILNENVTDITVLTDELGLQREYREVKRKAVEDERIKVTDRSHRLGGEVLTVIDADINWSADSGSECRDGTGVEVESGDALFHRRYVVLEPTDIIRINGERFRLVERKATVGERIVITKKHWDDRFEVGKSYEVIESGPDVFVKHPEGTNHKHGGACVGYASYSVLEPLSSATPEQPTEELTQDSTQSTIDGLVGTVANLARRLTEVETQLRMAREDVELLDEATSEEVGELRSKIAKLERKDCVRQLTPTPADGCVYKPMTRDEIIEKAKADVAELVAENHTKNDVWFVDDGYYVRSHEVEFVVNRNKRTVVALVREIGGEVDKKGIAKAAPDDCFNVYIGKAIALRRALGLKVPEEYVNAPQPTEPCVGDYVEIVGNFVYTQCHFYDIGDIGIVDDVCGESVVVSGVNTNEKRRSEHGFYQNVDIPNVRIIDDSHDGRYGEVYIA